MTDPITPPENQDSPTLESIADVPVADMSDEQKTFVKENAESLTPEQKETYKDILAPEATPEVIEPETRTPAQIKKDAQDIEDDDDIDPEDAARIGKVVEKRLAPLSEVQKQLRDIQDSQEVDAFIRVKPEFSKYRESIIKHVQHPAYSNIPVHNIAAMVASKDLMRMGAEQEREAQRKAKETNAGGGTQRKITPGKIDWKNASKEEFEAHKARVLGQG